MTAYYTPGICNINDVEASYRMRGGHLFAGTTVVLSLALLVFAFNPIFGLTVIFPATAAALQYLQVKNRFCVRYAVKKVFSSGSEYREIAKVSDMDSLRKDRKRSLQLFSKAFGFATAYSVLVVAALNVR